MSGLMVNATTIFSGTVGMVNAFTPGSSGVTAAQVLFAMFAGGVGLGLFSYVKNILR